MKKILFFPPVYASLEPVLLDMPDAAAQALIDAGVGAYPVEIARAATPGPAPVWRFVSTRGELSFGTNGTSNANNQRLESRRKHRSGKGASTKLRGIVAGFYRAQILAAETAFGNDQGTGLAIEIGGVTTPFVFSGVIPNNDLLISDELTLPLAAETDHWVRTRFDLSANGQFRGQYWGVGTGSPAGETSWLGATGTTQLTGTGAMTIPASGAAANNAAGPVAIIGLATNHGPAVFADGPSLMVGTGDDLGDGSAGGGPFRRGLYNKGIGYFLNARAGIDMADLATHSTQADELLVYANVYLYGSPTNDFANDNITGATALANAAARVAQVKAINPALKCYAVTMNPRTNASNVPSGRFANADATGRTYYNAQLRTNFAAYGFDGIVDTSAALENPAATDTWLDIATDSSTSGGLGIHSTPAGSIKEAVRYAAWADTILALSF